MIEQVCLGPVGDQSKGKRVVTGFIQGFGISGKQTAPFRLVVVMVMVIWSKYCDTGIAGPWDFPGEKSICWTDDQGPAVFTELVLQT